MAAGRDGRPLDDLTARLGSARSRLSPAVLASRTGSGPLQGDRPEGTGARLLVIRRRRIVRRMPRLQVYLPDDLYRAVKDRQLPASELLQGAVREEVRRQELLEATDRYLTELVEEVGEPSSASVAKAERLAGRVRGEKMPAHGAS